MIRLENLSKSYVAGGIRRVVADRLNAVFPAGRSVALLGRNGAGKSSLLRMIAGTMRPDAGTVQTAGSISWPVGLSASFHPELSGAQNARFVARIYGVDATELCAFAEAVAGLGPQFRAPFGTYSSGMRARLAFAVSLGVGFDTYLVDEVTAVGDVEFRERSEALLRARLSSAGAIVVSHSMPMLRRLCDCGMVLENGRLRFFADIESAIRAHHRDVRGAMTDAGGAA